ncbi:SDH family Clp fold serine proteinase [Candidatus Avelusimicrobium fimicolum]|uniref:SDH family Clp fold serine proteinase n=1 Tax=Candidatus Avelusimicrobium fimicolum TaxID=3416216 RepID=UPI003D0B51AE
MKKAINEKDELVSPSLPQFPVDSDVYVYSGPISYNNVDKLRDLILTKKCDKTKTCILFISTFGGDADSAFRLANCIKQNYKEFKLVIPCMCKSAGTLISMAADSLYFGPKGELGPLDVQMSKRKGGDTNETISGLDIFFALDVLTDKMLNAFYHFNSILQKGTRVAMKTSLEISAMMVTKMFSPVMEQINPLDLGEMHRAMNIAQGYAKVMASHNFKKETIGTLIGGYPCHSFVLDENQAKQFFNSVYAMENWMLSVKEQIPFLEIPDNVGQIIDLTAAPMGKEEQK